MILSNVIVSGKEFDKKFIDSRGYKINLFREKIFGDCPHVGKIKTDYRLCEEIVSKLPDLNDKHVLVLFNPEFYAVIHATYPRARITLMTGSKKAAGLKFAGIEQVIEIDPFNDIDFFEVLKMKFDVVIGNPPFAAPKSGDYSFWARFVQKGVELIKDNGYLAMITPSGWMSATADIRKGRISILRDIFAKYNLIILNISSVLKNFFPGIGSSFSYYILNKNGKYKETKIISNDGEFKFDIRNLYFFPLDNSIIGMSIIKKLTSMSGAKFEFTRHCCNFKNLSQNKNSDKEFEYINGNSNHLDKPFWGKIKTSDFGKNKVIIPYNGTKYKFIVDGGKIGITNCYWYELNNNETIEGAKTFFNSNLITWFVSHKRTQYNEGSVINALVKINLSKTWTDAELYEYFKLTPEEIQYVENNI